MTEPTATAIAPEPAAAVSPATPTPAAAEQAAAIAAMAAAMAAAPATPGVAEYDWHAPNRFIRAERDRLQVFATKAAAGVSRELTALLRNEVPVEIGPVTQNYGAALWAPEKNPLYGVPLTDKGGRVVGMVGLPPETAVGWVERLLGGSAGAQAGARPLSSLESALLLDIVAVMIKTFASASKEAGGPVFQHAEDVSIDKSPLADRADQEFCKFALMVPGAKGKVEIAFCLLSELLAPLAEETGLKKRARTAEDIRKDIHGHLESMPVAATARLGTITATMRDIASLEPGDVLLMGRTVNDPIELLVLGNVVLCGFPVACDGYYAIQVKDQREHPRVRTH